ncbi:polyprenyl synthetase family protein [Kitasatospora sp. NBC_01287]|uniref:polyprenyl synthetase family protein n=1 Tax=Kitasatospora sp. NBC_01287 TaxID=2903573 RepID=UPI0022551333|nr:polyprenyl synthetase family protein [Kitasatospora sp. NBC_01287]MCX4745700.1 polyprenyl synthetase family protein [Kitasatospora sp. NBC_01287]
MTDTSDPTAQLQRRLAGYERRFADLFAAYFDNLRGTLDAPAHSRFTPECLDLLRDLSLRGGKRLRVALLHEAARLVSTDEDLPGLDDAALSIELLQTHGLVHDDIIDNSPTRRGAPSTYYAYRARFPDHPQAALGLAVLAGDLAAFLSLRVLLESTAPLPLRQAMLEVQTRAATATFVGQIIDLERDFTALPDEEQLHAVADYKSARYSVLAPLQLGLLAAGEQPHRFDAELRRYARLVGVYEQMRDDYLDLFGNDAQALGKPIGGDLREGRRSYAVSAILAAATEAERAVVEAALGDRDCPPYTVAAVREIGHRHGVDQHLRAEMRRYAQLASAEAAGWRPRWREEAVTFFEQLPLWSLARTL